MVNYTIIMIQFIELMMNPQHEEYSQHNFSQHKIIFSQRVLFSLELFSFVNPYLIDELVYFTLIYKLFGNVKIIRSYGFTRGSDCEYDYEISKLTY